MAIHHRGAVIGTAELEDTRPWSGPGLDPASGKVPVGVTAGCWNAYWPLWRPGAGMTNGLVYGAAGSGKTAVLELLLREAEASESLTAAVIDGTGVNLGHWGGRAAYAAAGAAGAVDVLRQLLDDLRGQFGRRDLGRYGAPVLEDPAPQRPGVVLVIDDAATLFTHPSHGERLRSLMELYLRNGRGLGFGAIASVSTPAAECFGSTVLRDAYTAGPVLALRTADRHGTDRFEHRLGDLPPSHRLPRQWADGSGTEGLGYLLDTDPDTAPVLCRTLFTGVTAAAAGR